MTNPSVPNLTFKQWRSLPISKAVDWYLTCAGMTDDMVKREKLTFILTREREEEEEGMIKSP